MTKRQRAYKTKLRVNNRERAKLAECAGLSRFVYNWGLSEWKGAYDRGEKPTAYSLNKRFNAIKYRQFPWVAKLPYVIAQESFGDLGRAYSNFFRNIKAGKIGGYPRFKKQNKNSFRLRGWIRVESKRIKVPVLGWLRLAEADYIPIDAKINSVTMREMGGDWFVSVQVEEDVPDVEPASGAPIGVDLGVKSLAVISDGRVFDNPHTLASYEARLVGLQRELSRRTKGGANYQRTAAKIAKLHRKIADARRHTLHNISHHVTAATRPRAVVIEDLNVKEMMVGSFIAKHIADASMGELRRQIEYKAVWAGVAVVVADRWFPSSKMCGECGAVAEDLPMAARTWTCPACGAVLDRDLNAARNLADLAG